MKGEPSLYIGEKPWYIGRFWEDPKTGIIREDTETESDQLRRQEKTIKLARGFGFVLKEEKDTKQAAI